MYRPISRRKSLKLAGSHGYIIARNRLRKQPPPNSITVELSVYALLHMAYLSKGKSARERVEAALDRLCRFVGKMPGVLHSWERTETNALRLEVNGEWLEHPYAPVPLPLPLRSSTALALLLFLANHATLYKLGVSQEKLCSVLGVSGRHTAHRENILFKALVVIENLLDQLPSSALKSAKFPGCFEVKELDDGKMMFTRIPRREEPEIALGSDEAENE